MGKIYKNITTTDATFLSGKGNVIYKSLSVINTSASYKYSVDLYLSRTNNAVTESRTYVGEHGNWDTLDTVDETYYILKTVQIPVGATLVLDSSDLLLDFRNYSFYIKINDITGSGVTVDVIVDVSTSPEGASSTSLTY